MSPHALPIETTRLILIPTTLEHLEVELNAPEQFGELLGAVAPASWPPGLYDRDAMQFFHVKLTEGGDAAVGWYGWYAIQKAVGNRPSVLVACGGYFGPPTADGLVEIGYSVAPEFRRRGFATELIAALVERAVQWIGVRRIAAETGADNIASRRCLKSAAFTSPAPAATRDTFGMNSSQAVESLPRKLGGCFRSISRQNGCNRGNRKWSYRCRIGASFCESAAGWLSPPGSLRARHALRRAAAKRNHASWFICSAARRTSTCLISSRTRRPRSAGRSNRFRQVFRACGSANTCLASQNSLIAMRLCAR